MASQTGSQIVEDSQAELAFLDFSATDQSQSHTQHFETQESKTQNNNGIADRVSDSNKTNIRASDHLPDTQMTQNSQLPAMDARLYDNTQMTQQSQNVSFSESNQQSITQKSNSQFVNSQSQIVNVNVNNAELDDDDTVKLEFRQFDDQHVSDNKNRNNNVNDNIEVYDVSQTQTQTQTQTQSQTQLVGSHTLTQQLDLNNSGTIDDRNDGTLNDDSSHLIDRDDLQCYNFDNLPKHACSYCGIHNPSCVVRCETCEKWFCNARNNNTAGTHIIHHLVRSKHKNVSLHRSCPIGETSLECYNCGTRNIFLLGFVPATNDGVVVLLCREQCLHIDKLKEMEWDGSAWQPLIRDRELLDWLVQSPSAMDLARSRQITSEQMNGLEELWKSEPAATYDSFVNSFEAVFMNDHVDHVLITYEDAQHFERIYSPLVALEAEYDKKMKECQVQEFVQVKWDVSLGKKRLVHFGTGQKVNSHSGYQQNGAVSETELRVVPGDELLIKSSNWHCNGTVSAINEGEGITIELRPSTESGEVPKDDSSTFRVEFIWKSTSFDRQQFAMKTLIVDDYSVTAYLYHLLMGHEVVPQLITKSGAKEDPTTEYSAPNLPVLNHSQINAVKHCLQQPLSLIQGPPGTGKTVTSATIVYHLAKQNCGQVLVSAPSNIAVDQLTMKIHMTGLKVVRLAAKSREAVSSSVDFLCLHNLVIQVGEIQNNELYRWHRLKQEMGELTPKDNQRYRRLIRETEKKLLQSADVICVTCVGAGDPRLKDFRFKQVLIDESTQATEPECLIPIVKGAKQIVLVGDHCQLGPVIMCKKAAQAGLQRSLFERLILLNIRPVRLQVQYRMHPCLSQFPSNTFYEGSLQNGVAKEERTEELLANFWPNPSMPMFFYSSMGREEFAASGTSYLNRVEAQNVEKMITRLLKLGIKAEQIGVVTPYEGQRQYILSYMQRKGTLKESVYETIEVASVDAFQGREKDYIILSCVRSNNNQGIGFLNDPRRLNVALTRAKFGLIVVGNPTVLSRQNLWNNLLAHFKSHGLLVEGALSNLKQSMITLATMKKYYHRRRHMQPVMPRTFGDAIPPRRIQPDASGYGNRQRLHPKTEDVNNGNEDFPPLGGSQSQYTQHHVPAHNSIRPPSTNYAYPGMINADLDHELRYDNKNENGDRDSRNGDGDDDVDDAESVQSLVEIDEIKEETITSITPNGAEDEKNDVVSPISFTQIGTQDDHDMDLITPSQAHANHPPSQAHDLSLQFASLGLTQDPQFQDIVSKMINANKPDNPIPK